MGLGSRGQVRYGSVTEPECTTVVVGAPAVRPESVLSVSSGGVVGSERVQPPSPAVTSRRQLREASAGSSSAPRVLASRLTSSRPTTPHPASTHPAPSRPSAGTTASAALGRSGRGIARIGLLVALVGVTVIVPVSQKSFPSTAAFGSDALADSTLPGTVEALTAAPFSVLPPASLVSTDATATRSETTASRSEERDPLPGCDGSLRPAGDNGLLASNDLCTLWDGKTQMRADAAVSLAVMNQAFIARFGADMCLSSGYRTLAQQRAVKAQKGGLAAAPGTSNHGWGLAVDLCKDETTGAKWTWLNENAGAFGWENPAWARPGGSGPYERWHWEYTKGVQEDGEYYG